MISNEMSMEQFNSLLQFHNEGQVPVRAPALSPQQSGITGNVVNSGNVINTENTTNSINSITQSILTDTTTITNTDIDDTDELVDFMDEAESDGSLDAIRRTSSKEEVRVVIGSAGVVVADNADKPVENSIPIPVVPITPAVPVVPTTPSLPNVPAPTTSKTTTPITPPAPVAPTPQTATDTDVDKEQGVIAEVTDSRVVELEEVKNEVVFDKGAIKTQKEQEGVDYPCLWLKAEKLTDYKATALKALLSNGVFEEDAIIYPVYLEINKQKLYLGNIDSRILKELLLKDVFDVFEKTIYINENEKITGDLMYAMCSC